MGYLLSSAHIDSNIKIVRSGLDFWHSLVCSQVIFSHARVEWDGGEEGEDKEWETGAGMPVGMSRRVVVAVVAGGSRSGRAGPRGRSRPQAA